MRYPGDPPAYQQRRPARGRYGCHRGAGLTVRLLVVIGSTRQDRFSEAPARWVRERLAARPGVDSDLLDLRDHTLPMFDAAPPAYTLRNYADHGVAQLGRRLDAADGFIVLTPEYNHGYSAVLKNAIDHTFVEWNRKPITFVGWGNVGAARAIEQLRLVSVELEMAPLRHAVHILPEVMRAVRAADDPDPSLFASLDQRLDRLIDDLVWWAEALSSARAATVA